MQQYRPLTHQPSQASGNRVASLKGASPQYFDQRAQHELLQRKAIIQRNQTGLPNQLKSGMEQLSGYSLDHVRVHYNSAKPAAVQAYAYAQGGDIHLASGQEKHLPHELGHVVQQMQGRVRPTTSVAGMSVNDSPALESEADSMGSRAMQLKAMDEEDEEKA